MNVVMPIILRYYDFYALTMCHRWHGGAIDRASDLRFIGRESCLATGLGQATYTCVPMSPSSITWYWSKSADASRLGRLP